MAFCSRSSASRWGSGTAFAQGAYPNKTIRVLIPYAPGGLTDVVARYYGDYLRKTLGQNVLVENKPGASGIIAIEEMARAKPDGYTIMVGNISTNCLTPVLLAKRMHIDYDRDVQIIARLADTPVFFMATTTNFPPKTFAEFIDYAKAHPDDVRYASAGIGAYQHVNTEILAKRAGGLQLVHIPFKDGGAGILKDIAGGDTHVSWFNVSNSVGMIKAGKVRPLAVAADARLPAWPDVPTLDGVGLHRLPSLAMVGGVRAGRRSPRDHRQAARCICRSGEDAGAAGDLREGRHDRAGRQVGRRRAGMAPEGNGNLAARHRRCRHQGGRMKGIAKLKIGILLGDDIGLEVVPEAVKVMKAAAAKTGLAIEWHELPIGKAGHEQHGNTLPKITEDTLHTLDGWIMGPIGHNAYPRGDMTWVMPPVRKKFDLFTALRPALSHPNIPSVHKNVDIAFFRELTEGMLYSETVVAGLPEFRPNDDITISSRVITRKGSNRVAREAFELARTRPRKKVTAAHKEPVYRLACGMFAEECRKVAKLYPDVQFEEMMIDSTAMKLVAEPQRFDVVVTTNQFGDILTDIGAGLVGGLGLAPGLCIGEKQAMAQATHGSAPDISGRNIANPYAMIMSGQMLMGWLGRKHKDAKASAAAELMQKAVTKVIAEGKKLTRDLGGSASTTEMGDAIAAAL